jgi:ABC-type transporter Mla subunit MlaD
MNNRELQAIISLKDQMSPVLKQAQGNIRGFSGALTTMAKVGFAAIIGAATAAAAATTVFVKNAVQYGEEINKLSNITGVAAEDISRLRYAAEQSDVSVEALEKAFPKLAQAMDKARDGSKEQVDAFNDMGVSVRDSQGNLVSLYETMLGMSDYYSTATNKTEALANIMKVLGRNGGALEPLFMNGREGLKAFGDEAERLGVVISGSQAAALDEFGDKMKSIGTALKGVGITIATALLPYLTVMADKIKNFSVNHEAIGSGAKRLVLWLIDMGAAISTFFLGVQTTFRTVLAFLSSGIMFFMNLGESFIQFIEEIKIGWFTSLGGMLEGIKSFIEKIRPFAKMLKIDFVEGAYESLSSGIDNFNKKIDESREAIDRSKESMKLNKEIAQESWDAVYAAAENTSKLNDEVGKLSDELKTANIDFSNFGRGAKGAGDDIEKAKNGLKTFNDVLADWSKKTKTVGGDVATAVTNAMDGLASGTASAFRNALESGENFGDAMRNMMSDLMFDLVEEILKSQITSALQSVLTPTTGTGGGAGVGGGVFGLGNIFGLITGLFAHDGGLVTPKGIKKYHSGGLADDEVPAILQTGERVLNRRQTREYDRGGRQSSGESNVYNITINAIDTQSFASAVMRNPGAIVNVVADNLMRNGSLRSAVRAAG